jgi:hypothetical protein
MVLDRHHWASVGLAMLLVDCSPTPTGAQGDAAAAGDGAVASDGASADTTPGTDGAVDAALDGAGDSASDGANDAPGDSAEASSGGSSCATAIVDIGGGGVAHYSGASLYVPAGAVGGPTQFSLCIASPSAPGAIGPTVQVLPQGRTFPIPLTVTLSFDSTLVPVGLSPNDVQVVLQPEGSAGFVPLDSTVDWTQGDPQVVVASTTELTQFAPVVVPTPLSIGPAPENLYESLLPPATLEYPYSGQLTISGGTPPYTWSVPPSSALPPGITLSSSGAFGGEPTTVGQYTFFVAVSDSGGNQVWAPFALRELPPVIPVATLTQVSPSTAPQGNVPVDITLTGTGFLPTTQPIFNGLPGGGNVTTFFVSSTQIVTLMGVNNLGFSTITLNDGPYDGGSVTFDVTPATANPTPTISGVSPMMVPISSAPYVVTVSGTGFITTSIVTIASQPVETGYQLDYELQAQIPASYLTDAGTLSIGVTSPAPGGGASPTDVVIAVVPALNPVPMFSTVSPTTVAAGSGALTLSITGPSFVQGAKVFLDYVALDTTWVSGTSLQAQVPAALLTTARVQGVVVANPFPGGGVSNGLTLTVTGDGG